ncbi:MAG: sulfotransferase family protein [Bacteroidota bacterium]
MSIQIIGAGFGRTGTASLKLALEKLGFDKCYHMSELIQNPQQVIHWETLQAGGEPDWETLFSGYKATVDFPGCMYYRQMMKKYPDAKVILTIRDADKWYKSASDTIYRVSKDNTARTFIKILGFFIPKVRNMARVFAFASNTLWKKMFAGRFEDKEFAKLVFNKFNNDVIAYVPKEKLLIFEIKQGWEPLCKFLNVPVPAEPFPKVNDTEEFNNRRKLFKRKK